LELNLLSNIKREAVKKKRRKATEIEKAFVVRFNKIYESILIKFNSVLMKVATGHMVPMCH